MTSQTQRSLRALSKTLTREVEDRRIAEQIVMVHESREVPANVRRAVTPFDVRITPSSFRLQVGLIGPAESRKIEYRVDLRGWQPAEGPAPLLQVMKRAGRDLVKWENSVIRDGLLSAAGKSMVTREITPAFNQLLDFIAGNGYEPDKVLIHPYDAARLAESGMIQSSLFHPDFSLRKGSSFIGRINDLDVHCMHAMKRGVAVIYDQLEVELFRAAPKIALDDQAGPRELVVQAECALLPTAAAVATVDFRG
ncbi:MAG: hypothetical protein QXT81_04510 [Candidatus Bathyarchaeia archaeon]